MTLVQLKYVIAVAGENSLNEAAKKLFISQPSLSAAIHTLEKEIGIEIFRRSQTGIQITTDGKEFLGYARQVLEQYRLMEDRYINKTAGKTKFGVSTQHYAFAVKAFANLVREFGLDIYEFSLYETRTHEVIDDVKSFRSELGLLYINEFNRRVLTRLFEKEGLEFHKLLDCEIYVYLWRGNPLAKKEEISMEELAEYPYLSFDQGEYNSFYFSEEVLSVWPHKRVIKANDRATMLNLMMELKGYTLCSGIICEELNGSEYCAIRLRSEEKLSIGYLTRQGAALSKLAQRYLEEILKFQEKAIGKSY